MMITYQGVIPIATSGMDTPAAVVDYTPLQRTSIEARTSVGHEHAPSKGVRVRGCSDGIEQMLRLMAGVADDTGSRGRSHGPSPALLRPLDAATGFSAWAIEEVTDRAVRVELAALRRKPSLLDLGFVEAIATGRSCQGSSHPCPFHSDRYLLGALVAGLCEVASVFGEGVRGFVGASLQQGCLVLRVRGNELLRSIPEPVVLGSGLQGAIDSLRIHTIQRAMSHLNALCILDASALPTTQLEIRIPVS